MQILFPIVLSDLSSSVRGHLGSFEAIPSTFRSIEPWYSISTTKICFYQLALSMSNSRVSSANFVSMTSSNTNENLEFSAGWKNTFLIPYIRLQYCYIQEVRKKNVRFDFKIEDLNFRWIILSPQDPIFWFRIKITSISPKLNQIFDFLWEVGIWELKFWIKNWPFLVWKSNFFRFWYRKRVFSKKFWTQFRFLKWPKLFTWKKLKSS